MIDLMSNENPYPLTETERRALEAGLKDLNRYLGPGELERLEEAVAAYCETEKRRVFLGPGTESLMQKVLLKCHKGRDLVVLHPDFSGAPALAAELGMKIRRVQLRPPAFGVDWQALGFTDSLVVLDSPNNPTGRHLITQEDLEALLAAGNTVVIDEAGYEYAQKTFLPLTETWGRLAVTRTFDKAFGLAGLRVAYMVLGDELLEGMDRSPAINRPAWVGALAALENRKRLHASVSDTLEERIRLTRNLRRLGLEVFESRANYLLVRFHLPDLALELRKRGVLVLDLSPVWLPDFCRISVGSQQENNRLVEVLEELLTNPKKSCIIKL